MEDQLRELGTGPLHRFTTWTKLAGVPRDAVGVYTIWGGLDQGPAPTGSGPEQLVYVGYSGRTRKTQEGATKAAAPKRAVGLWGRLRAHTIGRRSGDQFAVYVADHWVLPTLGPAEIAAIAERRLAMDSLVRRYIAERLAFRWVTAPDSETARAIEAVIKRGEWPYGKPLFNPA